MRVRSVLIVVAAGAVLCCTSAWAENEAAARDFASAKTLLSKGDFKGALDAFKAAAKAEPESSEYFQEYSLLRRILNLRDQIKDEPDPETWQKMARALYLYYHQRGIDGEALSIAQALHEKANSGESAALLADAQLTLDKNDDAAAMLAGLAADKPTLQTNIFFGIAQARLGRTEPAESIAAKIEIPKDCDGETCFNAARLYTLVGQTEKALAALRCAFESTPPNQLDELKADAKDSKDLIKLASAAEFASVLETKSKIAAGCGTAVGCGKCPSKGKAACAAGQDKAAADSRAPGKAPACEHEKKDGQ